MDDTTEWLSRLCTIFAARTRRRLSTVSRLATGSGETIARLKRGRTITIRRAARAFQYLSDHWPDDQEWPTEIPRPEAVGGKLRKLRTSPAGPERPGGTGAVLSDSLLPDRWEVVMASGDTAAAGSRFIVRVEPGKQRRAASDSSARSLYAPGRSAARSRLARPGSGGGFRAVAADVRVARGRQPGSSRHRAATVQPIRSEPLALPSPP